MKIIIKLDKFNDLVYTISKYLVIYLVGSMVIIVTAQVMSRTFLGFSIYWSEEYARYALIWITFIGTSMAVKDLELAKFDLLTEKIPTKWRWLYSLAIEFIMLIFIIIVVYLGLKQTLKPNILTEVSTGLRVPLWVVYSSVPTGFIFMLIHVSTSMIKTIVYRNEVKQ